MTFLVSKPKCQSQECDIFGFETGFETKMSFSGIHQRRNKRTQAFVSFLVSPAFHTVPLLVAELGRLVMRVDLV